MIVTTQHKQDLLSWMDRWIGWMFDCSNPTHLTSACGLEQWQVVTSNHTGTTTLIMIWRGCDSSNSSQTQLLPNWIYQYVYHRENHDTLWQNTKPILWELEAILRNNLTYSRWSWQCSDLEIANHLYRATWSDVKLADRDRTKLFGLGPQQKIVAPVVQESLATNPLIMTRTTKMMPSVSRSCWALGYCYQATQEPWTRTA